MSNNLACVKKHVKSTSNLKHVLEELFKLISVLYIIKKNYKSAVPSIGMSLYLLCATYPHRLENYIFEGARKKKIAHWADEFSTDAFGEMLAIIT